MALNETDTSSEIFDEDDFLTKLDNLKSSKNAIESLSTWIIFHKNYHETICQLWFEKLNEISHLDEKILAMFYLAHEVIKSCKIKNAECFKSSFKKYLLGAVEISRSEVVKKQIHQVLESWSERFIFEKEFLSKLNEVLFASNDTSSILPYKSLPVTTSRQSVDSGISSTGRELSQFSTSCNDEDIICLTPSISMPKMCFKINPLQIMTSTDPNCAGIKHEMEQFMRLNNDILYRRSQFEQLNQEAKLKETNTKIDYDTKFKEQELEFKKKLQEIAILDAQNGKIDNALKIYSVINNKESNFKFSSSDESTVDQKKTAEPKTLVVEKIKAFERVDDEDTFDIHRFRHLICFKEKIVLFEKFKILYSAACDRTNEKTCPKNKHFHFIVDVNEYKCHLSSFFKKKQSSNDYYKSFQIKDKTTLEGLKEKFEMEDSDQD